MINRTILIGRLCADPELRYTPNGVAVATLRLAVPRRFKVEGQPETDFFNVIAWKHSAEFAANYLAKGQLVGVDGRLQERKWTSQDGQKRSTVEVVADHVQAYERKEERPGDAEPESFEEDGGGFYSDQ